MHNIKRRGFLLAVAISLSALPSFVFADSRNYREVFRESLRGIKGVWIYIDDLEPQIETDGLTKDQILADVKQRLKLGGIKLLSENKFHLAPGSPYLDVIPGIIKSQYGRGYIYSIIIRLHQAVYLKRSPDVEIEEAITWVIAGVGATDDLNTIRETIKILVDEFINDYLSVNLEAVVG